MAESKQSRRKDSSRDAVIFDVEWQGRHPSAATFEKALEISPGQWPLALRDHLQNCDLCRMLTKEQLTAPLVSTPPVWMEEHDEVSVQRNKRGSTHDENAEEIRQAASAEHMRQMFATQEISMGDTLDNVDTDKLFGVSAEELRLKEKVRKSQVRFIDSLEPPVVKTRRVLRILMLIALALVLVGLGVFSAVVFTSR